MKMVNDPGLALVAAGARLTIIFMKSCLSTVAGFFLTALSASAAEVDAAPLQKNFLEVLAGGGPMMYLLVLLSVLGVLLIVFYLLTIRRNAVISDRFMNTAEAMIRKRDYLGLVAYSHRQNECIARITQKAVDFMTKNPSATMMEVRELAQSEGSRQSSLLTSRISYLADLGAIAPMVGLLGTVIGMIKSFVEISGGSAQGVRQMELAAGVSEALIATASGLAIAIPALTFYAIFRGRVHRYISDLESGATHLMALLNAQVDRQAPAAYSSAPAPHRNQQDYGMPVQTPLGVDRPDLHGI